MSAAVHLHERLRPGKPVDLFFLPAETRMMIKSLSVYDPDFTRSFVDGRAYAGFSHAEALQKTKCPVLLLQANWFRHPRYGLVGSMDEEDLRRFHSLVPQVRYQRITSGHMIHFEKPKEYRKVVTAFIDRLPGK
jgi:pimeloyl-ACP methyl ester carboxylesterase